MWRLYLLLSLQVMIIKSLPMYLPERLPKVRSPLPLLQEELLRLQAMQQFQAVPAMQNLQHLQDLQQLQALPDMQQLQVIPAIQQSQFMPAMPMNQVKPLLVLLPGLEKASDSNNVHPISTKIIKDEKEHKETMDEDLESVMIEAEEPTIDDQKAILLMPNPRFSINSIISAIPFLPFEINVPDTIAWMYNGIISIIGQIQNFQSNRLKFKQFNNISNIRDQQLRPIIVIPL